MKNNSEGKLVIKVVQMDRHFLYLPFYYAMHCDFFGYLPENYILRIQDLPRNGHTDENAYKTLMEAPSKNQDVHFAICDPIVVFNEKYKTNEISPAILGALITNSAFWAIDHHTHSTIGFKDLGAYDKIISYLPGTTSYNIAERLYKVSGKTCAKEDFIKVVQPNLEILTLNESQSGTIALSPNPFEIDELISNGDGKFKINLSLGNTPEYNNVLVTALISRKDFVQQHPELILGLLKALQRSMLLIRHYDDKHESNTNVLNFTEEYFTDGKNARGALRLALDSQVFPANLEITRGQWLNAIRANYFEISDDKSDAMASHAYDLYIDPYLNYAKQAAKVEIASKIFPFNKKAKSTLFNIKTLIVVLIICIITIIGILKIGFLKISPVPIGAILAYLISVYYNLYQDKRRHSIHLFVMTALVCYTLFLLNVNMPGGFVSLAVYTGLLGIEGNTINASIKSNK